MNSELYEAAKREGELTWYSGQLNAETGEAVGRAFTQRYPGVKVNVVRSTSQVAYQRLSQDMQAGVAQCDMFSSTDYGHYLFLKREGSCCSSGRRTPMACWLWCAIRIPTISGRSRISACT